MWAMLRKYGWAIVMCAMTVLHVSRQIQALGPFDVGSLVALGISLTAPFTLLNRVERLAPESDRTYWRIVLPVAICLPAILALQLVHRG